MLRYLQEWIDQLRWQRLKPMEKLAHMLLDHLEGIFEQLPDEGTYEGGGSRQRQHQSSAPPWPRYRDMSYLLLKAQRLAATKTEFIAFQQREVLFRHQSFGSARMSTGFYAQAYFGSSCRSSSPLSCINTAFAGMTRKHDHGFACQQKMS